jgi:cobalt/nickel transport system permease protein
MHIEPGLLAPEKLTFATGAAVALLGAFVPALLKSPSLWLRTVLASVFFSLFMQAFHMKAGPSELHFLGAMPIYLAFGFIPTLFGFGLGLLLQGLIFEPQDLVHLAVNTLTLAVPLIGVHWTLGRRLGKVQVSTVLQLDSVYYGGVVAMVGFWLAIAEGAVALADWAAFAVSYAPVVVLEPLLTLAVLALIQRARKTRLGEVCFAPQVGAAAR